jgi:hypothetical protein
MKASLGAAVGLLLLMPFGAARAQEPIGVLRIKACIQAGRQEEGYEGPRHWQTYKCEGPTAAVIKIIGQLERTQLVQNAYVSYVRQQHPRDYRRRLRGVRTSMTCNDESVWTHFCTVVVRFPNRR